MEGARQPVLARTSGPAKPLASSSATAWRGFWMSGCAGSMGASVTLHVTSLACGLIGGGWRVLMHGHATDLSPQCSAPSSSALPDAGCPKSSGPALLPHTLLIPRPSGPAPLPLRRPHPGLQRQQHPGRPEPQPPPHPEAAGSRSAGARQMPRIWEAQVAATQVLGPPLLGCEMLPAGQGNWQLAQADCKALLVQKAPPPPPAPAKGTPHLSALSHQLHAEHRRRLRGVQVPAI